MSPIIELDIEVRRRQTDPGVTFAAGSSPPRIERIAADSDFIGQLFVGDEILRVNDRPINTAEDFFNICQKREKRLHIRVRRDTFYTITTREVQSAQPDQYETMEIMIRWRKAGMPLGITTTQTQNGVKVAAVESGSIIAGAGRIRYGDIITHANGRQISSEKELRKEVHTGINRKHEVTLRIQRSKGATTGGASPLPEDVRVLLHQHRGYYRRQHRHRPILQNGTEERVPTSTFGTTSTESENSMQRARVRRPSEAEVTPIQVDQNNDRPLTPTPQRMGSRKDDGSGSRSRNHNNR